ncbi:hypothetical protein, partial [Escherichia coli]|uniref:hypothetical protein n=1 Tax=Escherichia coli TaxID=562 RepID=UPI001C58F344
TKDKLVSKDQLVAEETKDKLVSKDQLVAEEGLFDATSLNIPVGPMTRSRTRQLNQSVHSLLHHIQSDLEPSICPITLIVIQAA